MREFYERFYAVTEQSRAHARFCERAFGRNFCQHGFADMVQLNALLAAIKPGPEHHLLDLGCGNGMIAEYISDTTGAYVTGLDYMSAAIRQAAARTASKADRLSFLVGDINALKLPPTTFDAIIAIDTIYFSTDYTDTIRRLAQALCPEGQMAFFYGYGIEPGIAAETFPREMLAPERTPLAEALRANGLHFSTTDFTVEEYRLAQLRKQVLIELKQDFVAEDILFIYENRIGEAEGISHWIEQDLHRRYLYVCRA
jgi:ubiquinone/menaquinone biosynthesis C-methylase UbiE